jgi:hypothetical protein
MLQRLSIIHILTYNKKYSVPLSPQVDPLQHAPEQQEEFLCLRARAAVRLQVPLIQHSLR